MSRYFKCAVSKMSYIAYPPFVTNGYVFFIKEGMDLFLYDTPTSKFIKQVFRSYTLGEDSRTILEHGDVIMYPITHVVTREYNSRTELLEDINLELMLEELKR